MSSSFGASCDSREPFNASPIFAVGGSKNPDRQRRKQAEFLVHREFPWSLVRGLVVRTEARDGGLRKDRRDLGRRLLIDRHPLPRYYDIPVVSP